MLTAVMVSGSPCPATPHLVTTSTHAYSPGGNAESLDLYTPRNVRGAPLAVYVHGGAWVSGDKDQYAGLATAFATCGIATAVINYPLAPAAHADSQARSVAASVRWLITNAPQGGYDAARVTLIGHSAGAQLALYATLTGLMPDAVRRIVALGSVGINPSSDVSDLEPDYQDIYAPAFGADRAAWTRYDLGPMLAGPRSRQLEVLVIHGKADVMAPEAISQTLFDQLKAAGIPAQYLQPDDRDHWGMLQAMTKPGDPTMSAVERFVLKS